MLKRLLKQSSIPQYRFEENAQAQEHRTTRRHVDASLVTRMNVFPVLRPFSSSATADKESVILGSCSEAVFTRRFPDGLQSRFHHH